jgi:hypothetical protein
MQLHHTYSISRLTIHVKGYVLTLGATSMYITVHPTGLSLHHETMRLELNAGSSKFSR